MRGNYTCTPGSPSRAQVTRNDTLLQHNLYDFDLACEVAAHLGTASPRKLCNFWNPAVELLAYLVFHDQADLENIPINFLIG